MISGKWFQENDSITCLFYGPCGLSMMELLETKSVVFTALQQVKKALELTIISSFFAGGSPAATSLTDHTVCMNSNLYHSQLKDLQLKFIYSEKATKILRNLHRRFDRYYI